MRGWRKFVAAALVPGLVWVGYAQSSLSPVGLPGGAVSRLGLGMV